MGTREASKCHAIREYFIFIKQMLLKDIESHAARQDEHKAQLSTARSMADSHAESLKVHTHPIRRPLLTSLRTYKRFTTS
jgi:hypothetical protein